ncbi:ATP-binding protein [Gracilibacillus xinjiangensis]|uniref:histidine kinase n=1 Tax=Gracilibacillus xinjiangensis TaxID=1193282 RepID=A0ABV8WU75_9BACI
MQQRTILKHTCVLLLFVICLLSIRLIWLNIQSINSLDQSNEGEIYISEENFDTNKGIALKGSWRYYPYLVNPSDIQEKNNDTHLFRKFPEHWLETGDDSEYNFATYQLSIKMDQESLNDLYSIYIPRIPIAASVFINGELMSKTGNPTESPDKFYAKTVPTVIQFYADRPVIELTVQVSNDNHMIKVKTQPLIFGKSDVIANYLDTAKLSKVVVLILFLLLATLSIIIYFIRYRQKVLLYFFFLLVSASLMILLDEDTVLFLDLTLNYGDTLKVRNVNYTVIAIFILLFIKTLLPKYALSKIVYLHIAIYLIFIAFVIIAPSQTVLQYLKLLGYVLLSTMIIINIQFFRAIRGGTTDIIYLLLAAVAILHNEIWAILKHNTEVFFDFYPVDFTIAIIAFLIFWIKRFLRYVQETERLTIELQKTIKNKDDFLANTSHELRNPLHSMINIVEYVLQNNKNKLIPEDRKAIDLSINIGKRMSLLINDLLDLSQLKEKRVRLDKKNVHLSSVINMVTDMIQHLTEGKNVEIINNVQTKPLIVFGDENRIQQILLNILHNAVKYTNEGTITINAEQIDGYVKVLIADQGVGIESESLNRIFKPYEQATENKNYVSGGIGLGLTITQELVRLHGGEIGISSVVGKGTIISFTLPHGNISEMAYDTAIPVNGAKQITSSTESINKPTDSAARILIVDDEKVNFEVISKILINENYQLVYANNGNEALQLIGREHFQLIVSDVMMPGMSGYRLTEIIRSKYDISELPILLLTARARKEDLEVGFKAGANDYLIKPVDPFELRARVKVLIALNYAVRDQLKMEAAWLRAQINPHFLFNTINSILALNDIDSNKMEELLDHFIYYLQTSFDFQNANDLVSFDEELSLVKSYLSIEKVRFEDKLNIEWKIDENVPIMVPPLSIQTIIENAVHHAVIKNPDEGLIVVETKKEADHVKIIIKDNGNGIPTEVLDMLKEQKHNPDYGIGLLNTDKRLRQFFGYGLDIDTALNKGTAISFRVPISQ